jgi:hypothetical protein
MPLAPYFHVGGERKGNLLLMAPVVALWMYGVTAILYWAVVVWFARSRPAISIKEGAVVGFVVGRNPIVLTDIAGVVVRGRAIKIRTVTGHLRQISTLALKETPSEIGAGIIKAWDAATVARTEKTPSA